MGKLIAWLDLYFPLWRDMIGCQIRDKREYEQADNFRWINDEEL